MAYKKFDIDIGLMKLVWGKADKVHCVDNMNYTDYSDFLNPEFIDRKKAEKLIRFNYFLDNGSVEFVYAPEFHADIYPATGVWAQSSLATLNSVFTQVGTDYDSQGKYSTTLIITQISDKYLNEKLKPNVKFYYNVEKHDYIIRPEIILALNDERILSLSYSNYGGKSDTLFGQFDNNDFIEAKLDVKF